MSNRLIQKKLEERKKRGGCGMWKTTGIPFMYKNYKNKLTEDEINWYKENIKGDKNE